jgi:hypothetical protein
MTSSLVQAFEPDLQRHLGSLFNKNLSNLAFVALCLAAHMSVTGVTYFPGIFKAS